MSAHSALKLVAASVNPALALVVIAVAALDCRMGRLRALLRFVIPTALGIACIYVVQFIDTRLSLWQRYGGDYSTHTAFATTIVLSLIARNPGWKWAMGGVWLAYLGLIIFLRFHTVADVVAAAIVAAFVTLPWHGLARSASRRSSAI